MMGPDKGNRTALVLAGSRGIGFGIAEALIRSGHRVIVTGSNRANLDKAAEELRRLGGGDVVAETVDLTSPDSVQGFLGRVAQRDVDILVLNGPGPKSIAVTECTRDGLLSALQTNLVSQVEIAQALLPGMMARRYGRIIALTSTTALEPDAYMIYSNITRAGMAAYMKTLSREVASSGITANTILTGGVLTARLHSLFAQDAARQGRPADELVAEAAKNTPVGYIATPQQFAPLVAFLVSEEAGYVNGTAIPIDGGHMRGL